MILSHPSDMLPDMHPWTGLSLEDLAWMYPTQSECAGLGHPMVKLPDGERFANYGECICGTEYLNGYGERRLTPDPSDYRDPIDPRDWD